MKDQVRAKVRTPCCGRTISVSIPRSANVRHKSGPIEKRCPGCKRALVVTVPIFHKPYHLEAVMK